MNDNKEIIGENNEEKSKNKIIPLVLAGLGIVLVVLYFIIGKDKYYTVTFDTTGGSIIENESVKAKEKAIRPTDPIKEGFDFVKWELNSVEYTFDLPVEQDITLKAVWSEKIVKHTITFMVGDVEKKLEVADPSEIDISKLEFEEKEGYEIVWYLNDEKYSLDTPLEDDIKLEGKYEKIVGFVVKFNSDGGTNVNNQTVKSGEKAKEPTNVTKYAFIFDGWYLNNDKYDFDKPVTENITLKAKWQEDSKIPRYTVTFDSNGGSKVNSQRVIENQKASTPNNPTRANYAFEGWFINNNEKFDFSRKITSNISLKASWRELQKFTVTFLQDDGSVIQTNTVVEGNTISRPNNPTKAGGYVFREWQLNGNDFDFKTKINKNISLKATYTKTYTVTFATDGGSSIASQTVKSGQTATKPNNPSKNGFTFKEWHTESGELFVFSTPITRDITLTAIYTANTTNLTYVIKATGADQFSPDITLKVYDSNDVQVGFREIRYSNGTKLCTTCTGNDSVSYTDIGNNKNFKVVLSSGVEVNATLK